MVGLNSKFSLPVVGKVSLLHAAVGAGILYVGYNLLTKHKPFGYESYQGDFYAGKTGGGGSHAGGGGHTGGGGGSHAGGGGHTGGGSHAGGGGHVGGGGHAGGGERGGHVGGERGGRGGERGERGGGHDDRDFRERLGGLVYDRDYRTRGIWDGVLAAPSPWYNPGTYCPIPVPPGFPCPIGGIGGIIGGYPGVDIDRGIRVGDRDHDRGGREGGHEHGGGGGHEHGGGGGGGHQGGGGHSGGGGGGQHGRGFGFMKFSGQAELGYNRGLDEGGYGDDAGYGDDYGDTGFGFKGGHGGGGVGHGGDGRGGVFHGGDHDFDRGRGFHDFDRGFRRFDFDDRLGGGFWPGYEPFIGGYPYYPGIGYPYYEEPFLGIGGLFGPWGRRGFDWDRGFRGHDFDRGHGGRHFFGSDGDYGDDGYSDSNFMPNPYRPSRGSDTPLSPSTIGKTPRWTDAYGDDGW